MELEIQEVNLELSKKLKELGVKYESHFCWVESTPFPETKTSIIDTKLRNDNENFTYYSAFSVPELLELLPAGTSLLKRTDIETSTIPRYYAETVEVYHRDIWADTSANALAKLLIYLLENNK